MINLSTVVRVITGNSEITESIRVYCKREKVSRKNCEQAVEYAFAFEQDRKNGLNDMTDVEIFAGAMSMAYIVLTEEISKAAENDRLERLRASRRLNDSRWGGSRR